MQPSNLRRTCLESLLKSILLSQNDPRQSHVAQHFLQGRNLFQDTGLSDLKQGQGTRAQLSQAAGGSRAAGRPDFRQGLYLERLKASSVLRDLVCCRTTDRLPGPTTLPTSTTQAPAGPRPAASPSSHLDFKKGTARAFSEKEDLGGKDPSRHLTADSTVCANSGLFSFYVSVLSRTHHTASLAQGGGRGALLKCRLPGKKASREDWAPLSQHHEGAPEHLASA